MWTLLILSFFNSLFPSGLLCVNGAVPVLYVHLGEDAHFSWHFEIKEQLRESIWILNHRRENVFYFSIRGTNIVSPYKQRIKVYGNGHNGTIIFTLLNTTSGDAGMYYTQLTNNLTEGQELVLCDVPETPVIKEITNPILQNNLILNCSTKSRSIALNTYPKMRVKWTMNGEDISIGDRYNVSDSKLFVSVLQLNDSGSTFSCFAIEEHCNVKSQESIDYGLRIEHGPHMLHLLPRFSSYYIQEGNQLENITGNAGCNPVCTKYWTKENDTRFRIEGRVLSLDKISNSDSGIYIFHAVNKINEAKIRLNIIVTDLPPAPYLKFSTPAVENENLTLSCNDSSETVPSTKLIFSVAKYKWRTSRQYSQQSERYQMNRSKFVLRDVSRNDDGTIVSCQFTTNSGISSALSNMYVIRTKYGPSEVPLSVKSTQIQVREGRRLNNITCEADCNPPCNFKWHKDKQRVLNGHILSLGKLSSDEFGEYICQAFNDYGNNTSAKIQIDVLVMTLTYSFTCTKNGNVQMTCSLDENAIGMAFLPWIHTKNNSTIRYINGKSSEFTNDLTLNDCNVYDTGMYECRAYAIGDMSGKIYSANTSLIVLGPPHFIDAKTVTSSTKTSLTVRFVSNPEIKSTIWHRDTVQIFHNDKFKMTSTMKFSRERIYSKYATQKVFIVRLVIFELSTSDYGNYTVIVRNDFGESIQSVFLDEKGLKTWILPVTAACIGFFMAIVVVIVLRIRLIKKRRKQEFQEALQKLRMRVAEMKKEQDNDGSRSPSSDTDIASNAPVYDDIIDDEVQMVNIPITERTKERMESGNQADDMSDMQGRSDDANSYLEVSGSIDNSPSTGNRPIMHDDVSSSTSYDDIVAVISVSDVSSVQLPSDEQEHSSYEDLTAFTKPSSYLEIGDNDDDATNKKTETRVSHGAESNMADDELSSIEDT